MLGAGYRPLATGRWLQPAGCGRSESKGLGLAEEEEGSHDTFKCYLLSWQVCEAGFPGDAATHTHTCRGEAKMAAMPGRMEARQDDKNKHTKKREKEKTKQTHKTTSQNKE